MNHTAQAKRTRQTEVPSDYETGWINKLDQRYAFAREMRTRYDTICNDLGGEAALSYMQRSLIERGLWLEFWLSQQELELARGGDFDVSRWVQAANSLQGIWSRLGTQRRAKEAPSLHEYLAKKATAATQDGQTASEPGEGAGAQQ